MSYKEATENNIKFLAYNEGLAKAIKYAQNQIRYCRFSILKRTYYIDLQDPNDNPRKDIIEEYKYCKHFLEETKKSFHVSNHRHH